MLQQPMSFEEAVVFIPDRPESRFIPVKWFSDVAYECPDEYVPIENGEIDADDFVFEGINPDNLLDTSNVKLKSFTFVGYRKANAEDIKFANSNYRERVVNLYKFYVKYDPNIYTKSLGIESVSQKLNRIAREKDIDLGYFSQEMEELVFFVPGTDEYEYRLDKILGESGLPTLEAANYLFDLIKQVKENEVEMYKATYTGNNINQGFSQLSNATNNLAIATLMSNSSKSNDLLFVYDDSDGSGEKSCSKNEFTPISERE